VEKILLADGADFAIAEKPRQRQPAKIFLDHLRVVAGFAKEIFPAAIAAAQAAAQNFGVGEFSFGAGKQGLHVLGGGLGVAAMKLDGLADSRERANGNAAGAGIGADEIADEEVAAMKFLEVFIDDKADEKIAAAFALIVRGKRAEGFGEDFIGGAVGDFMDQLAIDFCQRPSFTDGRAALRNDAVEFDVASDGEGNAAFLENVAVKIKLSLMCRGFAAGEAAEDGQGRVGFVPGAEPVFGIQVERIDEDEPAVGLIGVDAGFHLPVGRAVGFVDLGLGEMDGLEFRAGQRVERQTEAGVVFKFRVGGDQAGAGAAQEEGDLSMDAEDFENLRGMGKEPGRNKNEAERNARGGELRAEVLDPGAQGGFIKASRPVGGGGMFHRSKHD